MIGPYIKRKPYRSCRHGLRSPTALTNLSQHALSSEANPLGPSSWEETTSCHKTTSSHLLHAANENWTTVFFSLSKTVTLHPSNSEAVSLPVSIQKRWKARKSTKHFLNYLKKSILLENQQWEESYCPI